MARQLNLPEVEACRPSTTSAVRTVLRARRLRHCGDRAGTEAGACDQLTGAARACNNLAVTAALMGNLKRSNQLRQLAVETDRKFGGQALLRFSR